MASARLRRRDKQLESLVKENVKLHEDVRELEDAYQLHRTIVEEDRNSVHGLIRQETGGSRWQHGGTGKLTTYKSSKDLIENEGTSTPGRTGTGTPNKQGTSRTDKRILAGSNRNNNNADYGNTGLNTGTNIGSGDNQRPKVVDRLVDVGDDAMSDDTSQNKILDLKSKILKKVSSKIIRRDTWAGSGDVKDTTVSKTLQLTDIDKTNDKSNIRNKKKDIGKGKVPNGREIQEMDKMVRIQENVNVPRHKKYQREEIATRRSRLDIHENSKRSSTNSGHRTNANGKEVTEESPASVRQHNLNETDMKSLVLENNLRNHGVQTNSKILGHSFTTEPNVTLPQAEFEPLTGTFNPGANIDFEGLTNGSYNRDTTRLSQSLRFENDSVKESDTNATNGPTNVSRSLRTFQTEVAEPTEIYIDTTSGEIRVRSGDDKALTNSNLDTTKVLIQHNTVNKSIDGQRLPCTIVEDHQSLSAQQEVRDIFGLSDLDTEVKGHSNDEVKVSGSSVSPFALTRDCNTEVEFWLHRLGLVDVKKYVRIFADHEIDLLDLEFMTAAQLHDMGVSSIGALDKILKGVKDLRRGIKPKPSNGNRAESQTGKHLQLSSIAWEEENDRHKRVVRKSIEKDLKRQGVGKSVNDETFVHRSSDLLLSRNSDIGDIRPPSAMSVHSDCGESLSSSRSRLSNTQGSFTASTKSSSAKCVEKRPPSSKSVTQAKSKSQPKTQGTIKRSNSSVSDNKTTKLGQLEGKPTRGVLIRQRSSSLSREPTPKQPVKKEKEEKEVKGRNLRYRSRSADVVKRKAMEGVQTAAKKFEVKQQKHKDTSQPLYHRDERMKARRNEMAARHQEREKHREFANDQSSDTDEETSRAQDDRDCEEGLGSLVTVNIMPQPASHQHRASAPSPTIIYVLPPIRPRTPSVKGPVPSESSTVNGKPDVRKSLRRVEPARRQSTKSLAKPVDLQLNTVNAPPVKSTNKVSLRDQDKSPRSQSEPESGYKTDGSTSYAQIEDKVTEIQKKIKRLKTRASTGDLLTGTLVQDLQTQLQQFQHILGTSNEPSREPVTLQGTREVQNISDRHSGTKTSSREPVNLQGTRELQNISDRHSGTKTSSREPVNLQGTRELQNISDRHSGTKTSSREPVNLQGTREFENLSERSLRTKTASPIEELLAEDQSIRKDYKGRDEVRMSKRELLDEMRKEKKHHHLQIRQLQQELERIKHSDPVNSMEIQQSDILYREEDKIGEGAFSEVYKGLYQGSEVAVKKLKVPLRSQDRNYFTAELSLLKGLRHPRVVLLIGVCTTDRLPLMVLEYMSKGSLYNYLHDTNNECFDHAVYFQVARDITAGMKYLHSHRPEVIHLDLKSMNVLLCQSFRAKIADFGFSKLKHDAGVKSKSKAKQMNTNLSTPAWMSPELINKGEVTTKTDVYSFAVILWEMLTRKEPYSNLSVFQILERVRKNRRPEIPISAPEGLHLLISQCWDPNPAKRPQFKDILQILENLEFPPAWRDLFKKAGVPNEALSNVQSTRNIIKLVTDTLDLPGPPNFMLIPPTSTQRSPARRSTIDSPSLSGHNSARKQNSQTEGIPLSQREGIQHSQRESIQHSQREGISERDKWESETVTTLSGSDESDLTLKDLVEESSSGDSALSSDSEDGSCVTSSDVPSTVVAANTQKTQKRPVNVFIPNLELSIESARKEFSAERNRISQSSWLSISLDDRTDRSMENQSVKAKGTNKKIDSETSLKLLSNRSSGSSTPSAVVLTENHGTSLIEKSLETSLLNESSSSSRLNESARSRRRNKHVEGMGNTQSDDLLMRESFNNLRPHTPKKRVSLTKKLMNKSVNSDCNSARSESADEGSLPPTTVIGNTSDRSTRLVGNSDGYSASEHVDKGSVPPTKVVGLSDRSVRSLANVDNSYDSFFGIPLHKNYAENRQSTSSNKNTKTNNLTHSDTKINSDTKSFDYLEAIDSGRKTDLARRSVYLIDNEADTLSSERSQGNTAVIDEVKQYINNKTRLSLSQSLEESNQMVTYEQPTSHRNEEFNDKVRSYIGDDTEICEPKLTDLDIEHLDSSRPQSQRREAFNKESEAKKGVENDTRLSLSHSVESRNEMPKLDVCINERSDLPNSSQNYSTVDDKTIMGNSVEVNRSSVTSENGMLLESISDSRSQKVVTNSTSNPQKHFAQTDKRRLKTSHDNLSEHITASLERFSSSKLEHKDDLSRNSLDIVSKPRTQSDQTVKNTSVISKKNNNLIESKQLLDNNRPPLAQPSSTRSSHDNEVVKSVEVKHDGGEQIRVVLNPKDGTDKKRPVITPRKSKMKSPDVNVQPPSQVIEHLHQEIVDHQATQTEQNNKTLYDTHGQANRGNENKGVKPIDSHTSQPIPKSTTSAEKPKRSHRQKHHTKDHVETNDNSQKSGRIRVKLRKDPLAPKLMVDCPSSPVPPPPPPPPPVINLSSSFSNMSRSMAVEAPRLSMADELKTRLNQRQSISEGMKIVRRNNGNTSKPVRPENIIGTRLDSDSDISSEPVYPPTSGEPTIVKGDNTDVLAPQPSDGLPSLVVKSVELRDQKGHLKSISKRHPDQLDDLSGASQEQLSSIADILRKAVMGRRLAMGEDADSVTQSMESSATGWSIDLN